MLLLALHICSLVFSASAQILVSNSEPTVLTTNGPIIGYIDPSTSVKIFKNIPYGADTSTTRFKAPVPPKAWTEPKLCTEYGPTAPQPWGREIHGKPASEDCLNLNIWAPEIVDGSDAINSKKRPVLVWFHGGGYEHMTSNDDTYDGTSLASKRDVVVVTVNHRVNGFGYLYFGGVSEEFKEGNVGQLDLILALKWVRDNVGGFGGDKDNVLIFGQSGGGAKCATLMAMPAAKGLFHRVWTMSGQQITGRTRAHAEQTAKEVLAKVPGDSTAERLSNLRRMPMEDLRKAMGGGSGQKWTPLVDGITLYLDPFHPTANEQSKDIPMVIGNTYDETRTLIGGGKPELFNLTWSDVPAALEKNVKAFLGNLTGEEVMEGYRKHYPQYSPSDIFFAASTASRSWKSMLVESDIRAKQPDSPLWVYYLRWKSPFEGGKWGAGHAFDIPMVFANASAMSQTRGSKSAEVLGDVASRLLVGFARTGVPSLDGKGDGASLPAVPKWPKYELGERKSMILDEKLEIHDDDRGWERRFFEQVEYIQPGT